MKRVIALWFILFLTNLAAVPAVNYFLFNHVDARYEAYVRLVIASLAEAVVLAAILGVISGRSVLIPLKTIGKPNAAGLFLLADGLILLLTLMPGLPEWIKLGQPDGFANYYMGGKALAGGILMIYGSFHTRWTNWDRRSLMLIGVILCALGFDYFVPWLATLARPLVAEGALLIGWLLFYAPVFALVLVLLTRLENVWTRCCEEAGFMVRFSAAFAVLGATILALNVFNRPYLLDPWASVAKGCAYLALTFLLAGSIVVTRRPGLAEQRYGGNAQRLRDEDLTAHTGSQEVS